MYLKHPQPPPPPPVSPRAQYRTAWAYTSPDDTTTFFSRFALPPPPPPSPLLSSPPASLIGIIPSRVRVARVGCPGIEGRGLPTPTKPCTTSKPTAHKHKPTNTYSHMSPLTLVRASSAPTSHRALARPFCTLNYATIWQARSRAFRPHTEEGSAKRREEPLGRAPRHSLGRSCPYLTVLDLREMSCVALLLLCALGLCVRQSGSVFVRTVAGSSVGR